MERFYVCGYVANPELLKMLCLHLTGHYSSKISKNLAVLTELGNVDDNGNIAELSPYFEQQISTGYWSDDYFEYEMLEIEAASEKDAIKRAPTRRWIYGPVVEPVYDPSEPCPSCADCGLCQHCGGTGQDPDQGWNGEIYSCPICGGDGRCQICQPIEYPNFFGGSKQ